SPDTWHAAFAEPGKATRRRFQFAGAASEAPVVSLWFLSLRRPATPLHAFEGLEAEEVEPSLEDHGGAGAENEAAGAHVYFVDHYTIGVVECAEGAGQVKEIGAQEVRAQIREGLIQGRAKLDELTG